MFVNKHFKITTRDYKEAFYYVKLIFMRFIPFVSTDVEILDLFVGKVSTNFRLP